METNWLGWGFLGSWVLGWDGIGSCLGRTIAMTQDPDLVLGQVFGFARRPIHTFTTNSTTRKSTMYTRDKRDTSGGRESRADADPIDAARCRLACLGVGLA